jgi:perosamine synthetase
MFASTPPTIALDDITSRIRGVVGEDASAPLHVPEIADLEAQFVSDCLASTYVSTVGQYVDAFERKLEAITGATRAVAVVNGTAALHMGLLLAGVQPGDEVLLPALTFVATANAVAYCQATPHLVDSCLPSLGIDVDRLEEHLQRIAKVTDLGVINKKTGKRISAIMPVHVFGHVGGMAELRDLAARWRLKVVEDAAEALGSKLGDRHAGTLFGIGALSFNGNKIVTTGGGGALLFNDPELGERAKHLTTTARRGEGWAFYHDEVGYNYRMPNLNAALGCAQLEKLPRFLAWKRALAEAYREAFSDGEGASFLSAPVGTESNYWLNCVLLAPELTPKRGELLDLLSKAGLQCRPVWTLMNELPMYAACPSANLSQSIEIQSRLISLPSSASLGARFVDQVFPA